MYIYKIYYILCTFLQITCNTDLCFIFMEVKLGYRHPSRFYFSYRPRGANAPSVSLHVHVPLPPLRPGAAVCPTLCGRRAWLLRSPGRKLRAPPPSKLRRREEGAHLRGPGGAGAAHRALRGMHPREQVREIPGRVTPGGRGLPTAV